MDTKRNSLTIVVVALVIGVLVGYFYARPVQAPEMTSGGGVACTMEAKQCPDGSYVGRQGPNCEFATCSAVPVAPVSNVPADWQTYSDTEYGFEFKYPSQLRATYTHLSKWPPTIKVENKTFSCVENNSTGPNVIRTEKVAINNQAFCRSYYSEGAAGSSYTDYTYTTSYNGKLITFNFVLRRPNDCHVYDEPKLSECQREQFDPNSLMGEMFDTLRFTN